MGTFQFDFKKKRKRNLEIIWGTNGSGKTHIFKAIKWCLYGYDPSPKDESPRTPTKKDAWECIYGTNKEDQLPPDSYMHVYLWFEDTTGTETNSYLLKRSARPRTGTTKVRNYTQIEIDVELRCNARGIFNYQEKIESILPVAASQFFMFHGEDLRYMSQEHLEHTKKAIEQILEAETFRTGIRDLRKIERELEKEHDQEVRKIEDLVQVVNSKNHFMTKIEDNIKSWSEARTNLQEIKKRLELVEEQLRTKDRSKAAMARLDEQRKHKSQIEDDYKKLLSRRDGLINQLPSFVIIPELVDNLANKQERHQKREETVKNIQKLQGRLDLANEISKLEECICGHDITEVEKNFIEAKKTTFKQHITTLTSQLVEEDPTYFQLRDTINRLESSNPDFETLYKDIAELTLRKDEIESSIKSIERKLSDIEEVKIRELTSERIDLTRKEGEILEIIRRIEIEKKENEGKRDRCIRLIKQREKAYSISTKISEQRDLTERVIDAFEYVLSELSALRKCQIMEYSSKFFKQLTNKPDEYTRIDIDDDYNVRVVDSEGNVIYRPGLSTAEREIVALSFILGLKNASEKTAPLILDTFFVHLDESHYSNIIRALPIFADQTILILTDLEYSNLKERAPESFFESVNNVWQIKRIKGEQRSEPILLEEV